MFITTVTATTMPALAFDVYGTLIDTAGVGVALQKHVGGDAAAFSEEWRRKQLEYTFRYAAMQHYRDFRECTRQALNYCCEFFRAELPQHARDDLMAAYLTLPAFADVSAGLKKLSRANMNMHAFSNGHPGDLQKLLTHAGIGAYFQSIVSVHDRKTFKPSPVVYAHFMQCANAQAKNCWLISGNPFDICGARAAGMHAVWLRRNADIVFDKWDFAPDATVATFTDVADFFTAQTK